jgi:uncharacterized protein DUF4124
MNTVLRSLAALLAACVFASANAADVYRWVDEKGVTNVSDVVPEKYKKVAERVDVPVEPLQIQRTAPAPAAATARPAALKSAVPAAPPRKAGPGLSGITSARPSSAASLSPSDDSDDCATLQRRYKESQDCFGPQPRTITGAINGARSPSCPVVVDPSPKCGLPHGGEGPPAAPP